MKVEVTNTTDRMSAKIAWDISRPLNNDSVEEILGIDLPVNEFIPINLCIESTLIEREIFASFRRHIMWAQGSRVQDPTNFSVVPGHVNLQVTDSDYRLYEDIRNEMVAMKKAGDRQDEFRLVLPLLSMTKYSIGTNFRSLVKIARYFEYLSLKETLLSSQFAHMFMELEKVALKVSGLKELPEFKIEKPLDETFYSNPDYSRINGIIIVSCQLPFHLRAQLVRHRNIGFRDNLFELFYKSDILRQDMQMPVNIQFWGTKQDIAEVVAKRNCWMSNYKVWKNLLDVVNEGDEKTLPCTGKTHCPYSGDAMLRVEGSDPNPPCPIHMRLNNIHPIWEHQIKAMHHLIATDERPDFWKAEMEKLS